MKKVISVICITLLVLVGCSKTVNETTLKGKINITLESGYKTTSYNSLQYKDGQIVVLNLNVTNNGKTDFTFGPSLFDITIGEYSTKLVEDFTEVTIVPGSSEIVEVALGAPMDFETLSIKFLDLGKLIIDPTTLESKSQEYSEIEGGVKVTSQGVDFSFTDMQYLSFNEVMNRFDVYSDPVEVDYQYFIVNTSIINNSQITLEEDKKVDMSLVVDGEIVSPDFDFMSNFMSTEVLNLADTISPGDTLSGYVLFKIPVESKVEKLQYPAFKESSTPSDEVIEIKIETAN